MRVTRFVWNYIEHRDHRLMRQFNRWRPPRWLRVWMLVATRLGDGWVWYLLGGVLFFFGGPQRLSALAAGTIAAAAAILLFWIIKLTSRRPRPCQLEPHCWADVLPPDQFSFPSGHAMAAFAITVSLAAFHPALKAPLLFLAVSIALSRLILGMHFLSDVLAGSGLGAALGYLAARLFR